MPDAKVDIFVVVTSGQFDVQEIIATLTTDEDGRFNTETAIEHGGVYEVSAVFRDTGETYLESSDVRNVTVGRPERDIRRLEEPGLVLSDSRRTAGNSDRDWSVPLLPALPEDPSAGA